ncbi:MAG: hypothetical protein MUE84_19205, partial [Hyphomonas sp.]|nr:hypothetical protein [Hyphomonas sp.]
SPFGPPHNLKAAGSNPAPATILSNTIKDFKAEHNARLLSFQILVNTWSTFYEAPFDGAHKHALAGITGLRRSMRPFLTCACCILSSSKER